MNSIIVRFAIVSSFVVVLVIGLTSAVDLQAQQPKFGFDQNYGVVQRLYTDPHRAYFKIASGKTAMTQKYYFVPRTHSNYDALVQLLYTAAENRWTLKVRTTETLTIDGNAEVIYFVVDF